MLGLIIGGAGSGKSEYAETCAVRLAEKDRGTRIYLATMVSGSREADERIRKHRRNRAGRGFLTIERYTALDSLTLSGPGPTVLLEDMGNLLGNEMFLAEGRGAEAVRNGIHHVMEQSRNLIIVANDVFSDGRKYDAETQQYLHALALLQRELAAEAQLVVEVVCGCANVLKGEEI